MDEPGVLSSILAQFATSGANILTINQSIPTNGCAAVTIAAETGGLGTEIEEMLRVLRDYPRRCALRDTGRLRVKQTDKGGERV